MFNNIMEGMGVVKYIRCKLFHIQICYMNQEVECEKRFKNRGTITAYVLRTMMYISVTNIT